MVKRGVTMIEIDRNSLRFSFPEVHHLAELFISFERTLRVPLDEQLYPAPMGREGFPLFHVDDYPDRIPPSWIEHGGVMLPMHQSEALCIKFVSHSYATRRPKSKIKLGSNSVLAFSQYPFAIKVAAGKINALTGKPWNESLQKEPQDYIVSTGQPWLHGYCVGKGVVRQFVAIPLGEGYTAEEQITGGAHYGGVQIIAYPMKRESYERRFPPRKKTDPYLFLDNWPIGEEEFFSIDEEMGLAPGGMMQQEIHQDPFDKEDWDTDHKSRCFVHIANSKMWKRITGEGPPFSPLEAVHYAYRGIPWFECYDEGNKQTRSSERLSNLRKVMQI
jgi:hypothetical protein